MQAVLVLEDGRVFPGEGFGAEGVSTGEIVFNTSMTGYQEILTDPSYYRQIVTMTVPHVGNTGVNLEDPETRLSLQLACRVLRINRQPTQTMQNALL